jgi:sec-independent protein translocase protein TatA
MLGGLGLTELLVVLAIVLLIFGPRALKSLGPDLGAAIRGFRRSVTDDANARAQGRTPEAIELSMEDGLNATTSQRVKHV